MLFKHASLSYRGKKSRAGKNLKKHMRLLFVVGAALLALILTVIWGIAWGEQANEAAEQRIAAREEEKALAANTPEWLPVRPEPIRAAYLGKITSLDAAIANAVTLLENGTQAISLPLFAEGKPHYSSDTAQALGLQQLGDSDVTLSRLFAAILADDGYIAATFSCSWQTESGIALRRARRAYEAALVAEIAESGANEVMLLDLTLSEDTIDEVALFLREIRENAPHVVIGMSVSTAVMTDDHHVEWMRTLLTWADHVALHLGDYHSHTLREQNADGTFRRGNATVEQILTRLDPAISRYRMRLLLPMSMYEKLETVESMGYEDWQIIK